MPILFQCTIIIDVNFVCSFHCWRGCECSAIQDRGRTGGGEDKRVSPDVGQCCAQKGMFSRVGWMDGCVCVRYTEFGGEWSLYWGPSIIDYNNFCDLDGFC